MISNRDDIKVLSDLLKIELGLARMTLSPVDSSNCGLVISCLQKNILKCLGEKVVDK